MHQNSSSHLLYQVPERRDAARSTAAWPVTLNHAGTRIDTTCTELSLTGLALSGVALPVGNALEVHINVSPQTVITARAEVVRRGAGLGLRFTHLGQDALRLLFGVLDSTLPRA